LKNIGRHQLRRATIESSIFQSDDIDGRSRDVPPVCFTVAELEKALRRNILTLFAKVKSGIHNHYFKRSTWTGMPVLCRCCCNGSCRIWVLSTRTTGRFRNFMTPEEAYAATVQSTTKNGVYKGHKEKQT
jgi:hypothetical protein